MMELCCTCAVVDEAGTFPPSYPLYIAVSVRSMSGGVHDHCRVWCGLCVMALEGIDGQ